MCCANCGITEVDGIKLEECDGCDIVRHCGDKCWEEHRKEHEEECSKRKALLQDKELFTQPDGTDRGECPLCFLPMPIDMSKSGFWTCCSQLVCGGCIYADQKSSNGDQRCPFCREPIPSEEVEANKRMMKRIKANDPAAFHHMGGKCYQEGDYDAAFKCFTKAAELGDADAHARLGYMYMKGQGVEEDEEKAVYHYEKAAIEGHPLARHELACYEEVNGNMERAVKHFIIAANLGDEPSMKKLWKHYSLGNISKDDLDATLRAHQAALDGMKSEQRDMVDKYYCK